MSDELKDLFALDDRGLYDWTKTFGEFFSEPAPVAEADPGIVPPLPGAYLDLLVENEELRTKIAFLNSRMPTAKPERLQHSEALSRALTFFNIPDGYGRLNTRA